LKNVSCTLNNLAGVVHILRENAAARAMWEECLQLKREVAGELEAALPLNNLANLAHSEGDFERSRRLHEESLKIRIEFGDKRGIARSLANMSMLAESEGDLAGAKDLIRRGIVGWHELGSKTGVADGMENLVFISLKEVKADPESAREQCYRAMVLASAAAEIRERAKAPIPANERASYESTLEETKAYLSQEKYADAIAFGRSLSHEAATAYALAE
jgi:hypothetical protein